MTLLEEPQSKPAALPALTGTQKAAILLVTLGEQASGLVMKELSNDEVRTLAKAIANLQLISPHEAEHVLEEFYQATVAREYPHRGGAEFAKRVLTNAFSRDVAGRLATDLDLDGKLAGDAVEPLRQTDPDRLVRLIRNEHPQTVAIILAHLPQRQAARLLTNLPKEIRADVAVRMASLENVSPDVIKTISAVLGHKLKTLGPTPGEPLGGARAVAEILNQAGNEVAEEILEGIRDIHETLEQGIRHFMFVFEDLLLVDTKGIKELVAKVDRKLLVVGLKGTSDQLKDHLLSCMSQRGANMLKEDMEAMGPIKIREVETAQQQIIAVVRMLEADGVLSLKGGGDDQYVL